MTGSSIESALVRNLNIFPTLLIATTGAEHVSLTRLLLPNLPPIENNLPIQPVNFLNRGGKFLKRREKLSMEKGQILCEFSDRDFYTGSVTCFSLSLSSAKI